MTPESNQQAQQQQQQQQQQQAPPEIAVPVNRNVPLALATTAAASEVAAAVQALAAANLQSPTDEALDLGDYGIYGVVSKISRKVNFIMNLYSHLHYIFIFFKMKLNNVDL